MFRSLILLGFCTLLACGRANQQEIDLSDYVIEEPVDGVGHYVYALNLPQEVRPGERFEAQMEWRTVGSVDPNARYTMEVILSGPAEKTYAIPSGANTVGELHLANWLSYPFRVPDDFAPGTYDFGVRLRDELGNRGAVPLGYRPELAMEDGYFRLARITVSNATE